jgi:DNA-binding transcriptional MerR regulator
MAQYSIKDLENLTGIKAHTIRIWEKRYGVLEPKRTPTNIRYYVDDDVRRLINISILNDHGFKISKISSLTDSEIQEKVEYLKMDCNEYSTQIESLVLAMINMDEKLFEDTMSKEIMALGFEKTFTSIVFPFMERIGILWQTSAINPGQEHFISNLIRQKIIVAIDSLHTVPDNQSKKFILYLPEGEIHELGILFLEFLIKKRNHQLIYLGQHTPLSSVIETYQKWPADIIITSLISSISGLKPDNYADKLSNTFPDSQIVITGYHSCEVTAKKYKNVSCFPNSSDVVSFLDNLIKN